MWSWWISGTGAYRMAPFYNTFDLREQFPFPMNAAQFVTLLQTRQGRAVPAGNQVFEPTPIPLISWCTSSAPTFSSRSPERWW